MNSEQVSDDSYNGSSIDMSPAVDMRLEVGDGDFGDYDRSTRYAIVQAAKLFGSLIDHKKLTLEGEDTKQSKLEQMFKAIGMINSGEHAKKISKLSSNKLDTLKGSISDERRAELLNDDGVENKNQNEELLQAIGELVFKSQGLLDDPIIKLRRLMKDANRLELESCFTLDPITRCDIRKANCQLMKAELPTNFKNDKHFEEQYIKHKPKILLFMLETGLLWEKDSLVDRLLEDFLVGEASIKEYLEGIVLDHSFDSSEDNSCCQDEEQKIADAELNIPNIVHLLQIIVHLLLYKNDRAIEKKLFKRHDKYLMVFEDPVICQLIARGLIELMNQDNIKLYFNDQRVKKMLNLVLKMMLSIESDLSTANLCKVDPAIKILKVGSFKSESAAQYMRDIKAAINTIVETLITNKYTINARYLPKLPELLVNDLARIKECINDTKQDGNMAVRFAAIYDLPRSILWLVMTLMAHYDFDRVATQTHDLCQILVDWMKQGNNTSIKPQMTSAADIFFSKRNWHLYEVLVEIKPSHFLFVMMECCGGYLHSDPEFLPMILPPLLDYLVKALNFMDPLFSVKASFEDIIQWIHCIQAFIDLYGMLSHRDNEDSASKARAKIELILKNMIGPKISFIMNVFMTETINIEDIVSGITTWTIADAKKPTYSPLLISKNYSDLVKNNQEFEKSWPSKSMTNPTRPRYLDRSTTCNLLELKEQDIPGVFVLELYCYMLRLFNTVVKNSELKGMQFMIFENENDVTIDNAIEKLDYLRNVRYGYMLLTEFHSLYSNLFMADLPEHSLFEFNLLPKKQTVSTVTKKKTKSLKDTFDPDDTDRVAHPFSSLGPGFVRVLEKKETRLDALKQLILSLGIEEVVNYELFPKMLLNPVNSTSTQTLGKAFRYFKQKSTQIELLIQKTNQFQGDMMNVNMKQLYKQYMEKSLLKAIYKYICSLMYVVPIEDYSKTGVLEIIDCFINNLATITRFFQSEINIDISSLNALIDSCREKTAAMNSPLAGMTIQPVKDVHLAVQNMHFVIVSRFRGIIELMYRDHMTDSLAEILSIARETFNMVSQTKPSKLYESIALRENASLHALHSRIKAGLGSGTNQKEYFDEDVESSLSERLFKLKKVNMTENGEFIKALLIGSEYSRDAYFDNIARWISMQLEEITSKSELYPGCNMILYSDIYSLIHIMDNLMMFSHSVRSRIHSQHDEAIEPTSLSLVRTPQRSIIVYLIEALVQCQKHINSSVFANTILLDIELCFMYCGVLKNLTQNNSTKVKISIAHWQVSNYPYRTAMEEILNHLTIDCTQRDNKIVVQDRNDLAWYNKVCLGLLTECLSGPCTENQDLIEKKLKGEYVNMFTFCMRMVTYIDNPFCHLQACVAKFLLAVFEGPNLNTMKRLNDMKPVHLYKLITNHLLNMWNFYNDPEDMDYNSKKKSTSRNLYKSKNLIVQASKKISQNPYGDPDKDKLTKISKHETEGNDEIQTRSKNGKVKPNIESLMGLYKADNGFATNSSIVLARTIYLIMTYAESSGLRRYSVFLDQKRAEQKVIQESGFSKFKEISIAGDDDQDTGTPIRQNLKSIVNRVTASNKIPSPDKSDHEILLLLFVFLNEITGTIEITTKDQRSNTEKQVRVVFPILPECLFFGQSKVNIFLESCNVMNHNERLLELINFSDETMVSIRANKSLFEFSKTLAYFTTHQMMNLVLYFAWIISAAMNVVWMLFADVKMQRSERVSIYERSDTIDIPSSTVNSVLLGLSCFLTILCGLYFLGWLFIRYRIALGDNRLIMNRNYLREGTFKRQIRILKLYIWDSLLTQGQPAILFLHILFVALYYFWSTIAITFHLLLFVHHFETTRFIIRSVTTHFSKILTAFLYILFLVYCCSTIIGYHYGDKFIEDFRTKGVDTLWISSFVYVLDYGLQGGGGIGDYMVVLYPSDAYFIEKSIVVIAFFVIVRVIFQNIMLGIIVDTFKELRGNQTVRCRIC